MCTTARGKDNAVKIMKRKILLVSSDVVRMNVNSLWTTAK